MDLMAIVLDRSGNLYPGILCFVYMFCIHDLPVVCTWLLNRFFPLRWKCFFLKKMCFFPLHIAMQETLVRFLGGEDHLEKEMATYFSILAWEIQWTEEPGGILSMGLQESDTT